MEDEYAGWNLKFGNLEMTPRGDSISTNEQSFLHKRIESI